MKKWKKWIQNLPLARKMTLTMVGLVMTLLAFLSVYLFQDSTSLLKEQAKYILVSTSDKNVLNHNYSIQETENVAFQTMQSEVFIDFLRRYETNQAMNDNVDFDFQQTVLPKLRHLLADTQKIDYIKVFLADRSFLVSRQTFLSDDNKITDKDIPAYQWRSLAQENVLDLPFNTFEVSSHKKGYIRVGINNETFFQGINDDDKNDNGLIVLNAKNEIVHTSVTNELLEKEAINVKVDKTPTIKNGFIYNKENLSNGWKVVSFYSMTHFRLNLGQFLFRVFTAGGIVLLCGVVFGRIFSRWFVQPISRLNKHISQVGKETLPEEIIVSSKDEVGQLTESYNKMVADMRELFEKSQFEEKAKHEAQLSAYQSQIQPHFLYNTLAIISWSAKKGDINLVEEITKNLAKYYRLVLAKGKRITTLKDELDLVQSYLEIQKIRFSEQLTAMIDIDPEIDTEKYHIMHRILQPLAENALEHGVFPKGEGKIQVTVCQDEAKIYLYVADNGLGTTEETVKAINASEKLANRESGFSLRSIVQTLQTYYQSAFHFRFDSIEGEGTMVEIAIDKIALIEITNPNGDK